MQTLTRNRREYLDGLLQQYLFISFDEWSEDGLVTVADIHQLLTDIQHIQNNERADTKSNS